MPMTVKIVTQEGLLFADDAIDMIVIPGSEGEMGVLPHHAALLTTLSYGEIRIKKGSAEESYIVYGGVAEISNNRVTVLADVAQSTYDFDLDAAQKARDRATDLMEKGVPAEKTYAVEELRRAGIQENVLRKVKQRPQTARIKILKDDEK